MWSLSVRSWLGPAINSLVVHEETELGKGRHLFQKKKWSRKVSAIGRPLTKLLVAMDSLGAEGTKLCQTRNCWPTDWDDVTTTCHLMLVHTRAGNMHVSCSHAITFFRIPVNGKITLSNRSISFHFLCLLVESGIYCSGGWWINPISRMAKNKEEQSMTDWQMHLSSCSLRIPSHYPIRSHQWEQHVALPWVQGRSEREWSIHKGRKVPDRWGCAWGDLLALSCWH